MRLLTVAFLACGIALAQDQSPPCRVADCKVDRQKDGFKVKVTIEVALPAETRLELYYARELYTINWEKTLVDRKLNKYDERIVIKNHTTGSEKAETAVVTARKRATFQIELPTTGSYVFKVLYEPRDQDAGIASKHPEAFARDLPAAIAGTPADLHAEIRRDIKELTSLFNRLHGIVSEMESGGQSPEAQKQLRKKLLDMKNEIARRVKTALLFGSWSVAEMLRVDVEGAIGNPSISSGGPSSPSPGPDVDPTPGGGGGDDPPEDVYPFHSADPTEASDTAGTSFGGKKLSYKALRYVIDKAALSALREASCYWATMLKQRYDSMWLSYVDAKKDAARMESLKEAAKSFVDMLGEFAASMSELAASDVKPKPKEEFGRYLQFKTRSGVVLIHADLVRSMAELAQTLVADASSGTPEVPKEIGEAAGAVSSVVEEFRDRMFKGLAK